MEDYIFTKRCVHGNANIFSRGLLLFLLASDCLWLSGLDLRDGFISFSDQNGCLTVVFFLQAFSLPVILCFLHLYFTLQENSETITKQMEFIC